MGYDEHGPAYPEPPTVPAVLSVGEYSLDHGKTWHTDRDAILIAINRKKKKSAKPRWDTTDPYGTRYWLAGLILAGLLWVLS